MNISQYISLCNSIVLLMAPLIEVIVHDLVSGKIYYINGGLSKRKVGDLSLLEPSEFEKNIDQIIYPKINFHGRLIKSISVPVDNKWLICINADASVFSQMKSLGEVFLNAMESKPESLFKNDWQEKLHVAIHDFLKDQGLKFDELNQLQKKMLTKYLFKLGAFGEKNAADYVANILGLGRATIFKYLKEWRNNNGH
ncbi:MAG: helix-turn-helix domain-containing protein [Rickettsiaceae bacterium]|nr:helix-turn-helix domain-containing protein [Rickettsiaceae bacterium]